jgi:hypothetical protein
MKRFNVGINLFHEGKVDEATSVLDTLLRSGDLNELVKERGGKAGNIVSMPDRSGNSRSYGHEEGVTASTHPTLPARVEPACPILMLCEEETHFADCKLWLHI